MKSFNCQCGSFAYWTKYVGWVCRCQSLGMTPRPANLGFSKKAVFTESVKQREKVKSKVGI